MAIDARTAHEDLDVALAEREGQPDAIVHGHLQDAGPRARPKVVGY
jgi:hypothetical protein